MMGIRKPAYIVALALLSVATSTTVVVDASEWYGGLYRPLLLFGWAVPSAVRGLIFAGLLECFLALMMIVRVPDTHTLVWRRFVVAYHPANWIMGAVAAVTVLVIGYGSWQGILEGNETRFGISDTMRLRIALGERALELTTEQRREFSGQGQRGNQAKAAAEEREHIRQQKELLEEADTAGGSVSGRAQFWFLAVAKAVMLGANMISLWLIGRVGRGWNIWDLGALRDLDQAQVTDSSFPIWTRGDFIRQFRRAGIKSAAILNETGLTPTQLSTVVNHASRVLQFIRKRVVHGDANGQATEDQDRG